MRYCGIDVSKSTFDVALFDEFVYESAHFENNKLGIAQFIKWCDAINRPMIFCMEATGIYYLHLAKSLHQAGLPVAVVNPIKTHGFARMEMQRNKTDEVDAKMIARFCFHLKIQNQFEQHLFKPKTKQFERLTSLVNRRGQLIMLRTEENNRKQVTLCKTSLVSIQKIIQCIDTQIKSIETQLKRCQKEDRSINHQVKLLLSIDGIGLVTAWSILAYLGDINQYTDSKKVASYAGLTPRKVESGSSINHSRLSKLGHKKLRKALYFPAIVATRHNQLMKTKYQELIESGKTKKTAICAIMRKLLVLSYGVLKSDEVFDPNYSNRKT